MSDSDFNKKQCVYLVGRVTEYPAFEVQGIFDISMRASELCMKHNTECAPYWFVMPLALNEEAPLETIENQDVYYPVAIKLTARKCA